ncbi:hypothetical protein DL766_008854 [Monosporascus sp. MC13-8B]|uniref:Centromere protein H C-terminal domain-containing protein n=1 Tax=Monosporascus cannonballus TaxID=155416 RepID=A0ABY0GQS4_9PEZI|nr:hypothetical protein DL762_010474 [Monosporascus cannonballus]RYO94944.1 hypothetical protein DL763_003840 [Monosporascus cannonballus]RYP17684.1 hypothetical protein DL766_008854 [Monosporascus sp. MC13-8B]
MDSNLRRDDDDDLGHSSRLEETLKELTEKVNEHEEALKKLRSTPARNQPGHTTPTRAPLEIMKAAYDELAQQTPFLPFPESVLPALLALRKTHQTVEETRAYLETHRISVENAKRRLDVEKSNLADQQALSRSLQNRIQSLHEGLENRMEMGPDDVARERIDDLKQKKKHYDREAAKLVKALRKFIENPLAGMLAAEELGGPVVGDMMDIDGDDLAAGFNSQGRPKKSKANPDLDRRQRRIDEIWGIRDEVRGDGMADDDRDETSAAAAEMRELIEELLNALMQSEGDGSSAYVQLSKETAAARFLVRSKVAQFHPKDCTQLRLVDFGRELDD